MFRYAHVRSNRNSSSHNEVNLASVLVCIVIMFLLCHFPRYQSESCIRTIQFYSLKYSGLFSTVLNLSWPSSASKVNVSSPPLGFSVWLGEKTRCIIMITLSHSILLQFHALAPHCQQLIQLHHLSFHGAKIQAGSERKNSKVNFPFKLSLAGQTLSHHII